MASSTPRVSIGSLQFPQNDSVPPLSQEDITFFYEQSAHVEAICAKHPIHRSHKFYGKDAWLNPKLHRKRGDNFTHIWDRRSNHYKAAITVASHIGQNIDLENPVHLQQLSKALHVFKTGECPDLQSVRLLSDFYEREGERIREEKLNIKIFARTMLVFANLMSSGGILAKAPQIAMIAVGEDSLLEKLEKSIDDIKSPKITFENLRPILESDPKLAASVTLIEKDKSLSPEDKDEIAAELVSELLRIECRTHAENLVEAIDCLTGKIDDTNIKEREEQFERGLGYFKFGFHVNSIILRNSEQKRQMLEEAREAERGTRARLDATQKNIDRADMNHFPLQVQLFKDLPRFDGLQNPYEAYKEHGARILKNAKSISRHGRIANQILMDARKGIELSEAELTKRSKALRKQLKSQNKLTSVLTGVSGILSVVDSSGVSAAAARTIGGYFESSARKIQHRFNKDLRRIERRAEQHGEAAFLAQNLSNHLKSSGQTIDDYFIRGGGLEDPETKKESVDIRISDWNKELSKINSNIKEATKEKQRLEYEISKQKRKIEKANSDKSKGKISKKEHKKAIKKSNEKINNYTADLNLTNAKLATNKHKKETTVDNLNALHEVRAELDITMPLEKALCAAGVATFPNYSPEDRARIQTAWKHLEPLNQAHARSRQLISNGMSEAAQLANELSYWTGWNPRNPEFQLISAAANVYQHYKHLSGITLPLLKGMSNSGSECGLLKGMLKLGPTLVLSQVAFPIAAAISAGLCFARLAYVYNKDGQSTGMTREQALLESIRQLMQTQTDKYYNALLLTRKAVIAGTEQEQKDVDRLLQAVNKEYKLLKEQMAQGFSNQETLHHESQADAHIRKVEGDIEKLKEMFGTLKGTNFSDSSFPILGKLQAKVAVMTTPYGNGLKKIRSRGEYAALGFRPIDTIEVPEYFSGYYAQQSGTSSPIVNAALWSATAREVNKVVQTIQKRLKDGKVPSYTFSPTFAFRIQDRTPLEGLSSELRQRMQEVLRKLLEHGNILQNYKPDLERQCELARKALNDVINRTNKNITLARNEAKAVRENLLSPYKGDFQMDLQIAGGTRFRGYTSLCNESLGAMMPTWSELNDQLSQHRTLMRTTKNTVSGAILPLQARLWFAASTESKVPNLSGKCVQLQQKVEESQDEQGINATSTTSFSSKIIPTASRIPGRLFRVIKATATAGPASLFGSGKAFWCRNEGTEIELFLYEVLSNSSKIFHSYHQVYCVCKQIMRQKRPIELSLQHNEELSQRISCFFYIDRKTFSIRQPLVEVETNTAAHGTERIQLTCKTPSSRETQSTGQEELLCVISLLFWRNLQQDLPTTYASSSLSGNIITPEGLELLANFPNGGMLTTASKGPDNASKSVATTTSTDESSVRKPNVSINYLEVQKAICARESAYSQRCKSLITQYIEWLVSSLSAPEDATQPPFLGQANILFELNNASLPIAFPKRLVIYLQRLLQNDSVKFQSAGLGTLIPMYKFHLTEGINKNKLYALDIVFCLPIANGELKKYCFFRLATFDLDTVESFRAPIAQTHEEKQPVNIEEFLIQTMYTNQAQGLGIPGVGTFRTKSKLVAPMEYPFEGLYEYLRGAPHKSIHLRSQKYKGQLEPSHLSNCRMEFGEHYINICGEFNEASKKSAEVAKEYCDQYYLLFGMCKLQSNASNDEIRAILEKTLGLIHPDNLLSSPQRKGQLTKDNKLALQMFLDAKKSDHAKFVARNLPHLEMALKWIKGEQGDYTPFFAELRKENSDLCEPQTASFECKLEKLIAMREETLSGKVASLKEKKETFQMLREDHRQTNTRANRTFLQSHISELQEEIECLSDTIQFLKSLRLSSLGSYRPNSSEQGHIPVRQSATPWTRSDTPVQTETYDHTAVIENNEWTPRRIARELYFEERRVADENIVNAVRCASKYLSEQGYVLRGTPGVGNCFFEAFLRSYSSIKEQCPLPQLDQLPKRSQIAFLRNKAADLYLASPKGRSTKKGEGSARANKIRTDREEVYCDEGCLVARALNIPIRLIAVQHDQVDFRATSDMLYFAESGKPATSWSSISKEERPKHFISIVDLGKHFIWAEKVFEVEDQSFETGDETSSNSSESEVQQSEMLELGAAESILKSKRAALQKLEQTTSAMAEGPERSASQEQCSQLAHEVAQAAEYLELLQSNLDQLSGDPKGKEQAM